MSPRRVSPLRLSVRARPVATAAAALLALVSLASQAHAQQAGFAFLEIPTSARAAALGGAYTSLARGADAIYWNPAALSSVRKVQVSGGHAELFQSLRHDYFALAGQVPGGGVAGSVRALYSEAIDERDELGNLIGSFGSHDLEFALGYGGPIAEGLDIGLSAQIVSERIASATATTYAFGVGAAYDVPQIEGLRAGAAALNLGPSAQFKDGDFQGRDVPLPMAVQAGAAYAFALAPQFDVSAALEGRLTKGRSVRGMVGAEVSHVSGAALRLGLRGGDTSTNVSAGIGYRVGGLELDYAYVPFRLDLGNTHRFSFLAQF